MLSIQNISLSFGGIKAIQNFSAHLAQGELLGIIGPNGAGKTTLFNILTGVYDSDLGDVVFNGEKIQGLAPHAINRLGLARTFQNIRLFPSLTVIEHVLSGFLQHMKTHWIEVVVRSFSSHREENELEEKACELLRLFGLWEKRNEMAVNLAYGEQRKLEIVRALATSPQILLLDEPAAGMNQTEKKHLVELIRRVNKEYHLAILLIEHDMNVVMNLCPRIIVLDYGEKLAEGTPLEIRSNPKVIEAYLGESV
ncbi:MAG TPA: high-affinity branched-chain amino acid ABC transporter ATP-binding protein LivG [Deltaproteobacteria bacterium]|nr:MAG: high-affinity branched-chain amino acid ABC transporter ATP-binding protein LivG [Deltaproteobacteria bacterium GWA2_45_12]HBF12614.1 high-affinity branched-chain amino acid ABC transporter ATP-binding protein LivG [Deltaproteobacteria bacterium]